MKNILSLLGAIATATFLSSAASAAVIGTYTYDYSTTGDRGGQGFGQDANGVQIIDGGLLGGGATFSDAFVFDDLAGATIDSFTLSFVIDGASERFVTGGLFGLNLLLQERWTVSTGGVNADDLALGVLDDDTTAGTTFSLTAANAQAFDDAVSSLQLGFSFDAEGLGLGNSFTLASATLTVNGSAAVVPLPAPGFLLLGALGGLAFLRRKTGGDGRIA